MSVSHDDRLEHERQHGVFLATNPAKYWGHESLAGQLRVKRRIDIFKEIADLKPGIRICEIGCGTGIFTKKLLDQTGATIVAVDVSPELLEIAKKHISDERVRFILGDCMNPETLGVPLEFDAVVTNSVLHHLDISKALPAIRRLLRPGGVFVCSEPNMLNPQIAVQKNVPWIKKMVGDSPDETAFFRWKIARALRTAGFTEVKVTPFDFLHPGLPNAIASVGDRILRVAEHIPILREIAGSLIISGRLP